MGGSSPVDVLLREWTCYLEARGHRVRRPPGVSNVLTSRNGRGNRYRWLLLHSERPGIRLRASQCKGLRQGVAFARRANEEAYLVVKFEQPEPKLLILPARKAMKAGQLRSDRGGIPWDPYNTHEPVEEAD